MSVRTIFTGTRVNRAVLAVVVAAAVVGVGFGTGYRSSKAAFSDGGAYLQKGDRLVHVNAANRDVDAEAARSLAKGKEKLDVVQVSPGAVYVVNNQTGDVTRLPTDSLEPQPVESRPRSRDKVSVVTGGGSTYLVDGERGTLSQLEDRKGQRRSEVPTPVKVEQAVIDSAGTVWAYGRETGELVRISNGKVTARVPVTGDRERATLTLAADAPVLYRQETGQAELYGPDGLRRELALGARYGVASAPGAPGAVLAVAVPANNEVVVADFDTGEVRRMRLPSGKGTLFGPPVIHNGRAHVPHYSDRKVHVVDLGAMRLMSSVRVDGPSDTFTVAARDNRVWVNDPRHRGVISFDADGKPTHIDLGEGDGVADDRVGKPTPTARPPVGPRETRRSTPLPPRTPRQRAPELVDVPDLVGKDRDDACKELAPELRCKPVSRPDGEGRTDEVLSTDPPAGSRVEKGRWVTVVYRGPATVPDLVGLPADQACEALRQAKLSCREQGEGLAATAAQVRVVTEQDVPPNSPVATDSAVTISYPVQIGVPDFTNQPVATACAALNGAGLVCAPNVLGPGAPPDVVLSQTPAPGSGLDPNGTVTVNQYRSPGVPDLVGKSPDEACALLAAEQLGCNRSSTAQTPSPNVVVAQDPPAGTLLPSGTGVTITYGSPDAPVQQLNRFKIPGAGRSNFITTGGGGPAGWSAQSALGRVYPAGASGAVPGLVPIYRFGCRRSNQCAEPGYYFSANPAEHAGFVSEGEAFTCFSAAVPGTQPLHALMNGDGVWVWAVPGTGEYNYFKNTGFTAGEFAVCNIWPLA